MSTGMVPSINHLDDVTRGTAWRRVTPVEVVEAIDDVLHAWRAAHR